jgi:hypothetical protein
MIAARRHLFTLNGRHIWLSVVEQDLFVKMAPEGTAACDDNGRLTIECADGSSRPCGFDPDAVRERIRNLEKLELLVRIPHKGWSLTAAGRRIQAELLVEGGVASPRNRAPTVEPVSRVASVSKRQRRTSERRFHWL